MDQPARQLPLDLRMTSAGRAELRDAAAAENKSLPIHRWVPWIAGFSAQFVQDAISAYLPEPRRVGALVVDPFAGVGTTLVEALTAGCDTLGYDVNAFAVLAARVKLSAGGLDLATLDAETARFLAEVTAFEASVDEMWSELGALALVPILDNLRPVGAVGYRSRIPFFSLPVEAKFRFALAWLAERPEPIQSFGRIALGATMVSYSNYSYEPSLSSRPAVGKTIADNAPVGGPVSAKLKEMLADVAWAQETYGAAWTSHRRDVVLGSYFDAELAPDSISLIVTSPPYLNNYHYLRNTRPQLHWLGLVGEPGDLRIQEQASFGKNWQTVRQAKPIPLAAPVTRATLSLNSFTREFLSWSGRRRRGRQCRVPPVERDHGMSARVGRRFEARQQGQVAATKRAGQLLAIGPCEVHLHLVGGTGQRRDRGEGLPSERGQLIDH